MPLAPTDPCAGTRNDAALRISRSRSTVAIRIRRSLSPAHWRGGRSSPDNIFRQGSHAGTVAKDQVPLQFTEMVGRDGDVLEGAKTRCHAIHDNLVAHGGLNPCARAGHPFLAAPRVWRASRRQRRRLLDVGGIIDADRGSMDSSISVVSMERICSTNEGRARNLHRRESSAIRPAPSLRFFLSCSRAPS